MSAWPRWTPRTQRRIGLQVVLLVLLAGGVGFLASTAAENLTTRGITSGFGFLNQPAGYDIAFTLIDYALEDSHARVFLIGVLNTLFISVIGIVLATLLGVVLGVLRLSDNVLMAGLVTAYVEVIRNIPLALQILFWYGLLQTLPTVREGSVAFFDVIFLNNRGLELPRPILEGGGSTALWLFFALLVLGGLAWWALGKTDGRHRSMIRSLIVVLIVTVPMTAFWLGGGTLLWDLPKAGRFNFSGGITVIPAFVALLIALSLYTAAFIAEIVRAGIQAVARGQREAALALGLTPADTTRRIILPQALRVIVPPLTSQYLNLTKNSSLGLVIGYPDLMGTFGTTTLNQTGQAVETIFLVMLFYLTVSIVISLVMNVYNHAIRLRER